MKIFLTAILFSTAALAAPTCPELTGHYSECKTIAGKPSEVSDVNFNQQVYEGAMVYELQYTQKNEQGDLEIVNDTLMADGLMREVSDEASGMTAKITSKCAGTTLSQTTQILVAGQLFATTSMVFSKNENKLKVAIAVTAQGQNHKETFICE